MGHPSYVEMKLFNFSVEDQALPILVIGGDRQLVFSAKL